MLSTIALVSISACSSDGIESSAEPQTLLFNQPFSSDTDTELNNQQSDTPQSNVVLSSDEDSTTTNHDNAQVDINVDVTESSTDNGSIDTVLNDQTNETTNQNSDIGLTSLPIASTLPVLPRGSEIPTMQTPIVLGNDTPAGNLLSTLEMTSGIVLANLNNKLAGGEQLSHTEENCLFDYDEAEGKPLLGLQCSNSIRLDRLGILGVQEAVFLDTESCSIALQSQELSGCELFAATIQIRSHSDSLIMAPFENDGRPTILPTTTIVRPAIDSGRTDPLTLPEFAVSSQIDIDSIIDRLDLQERPASIDSTNISSSIPDRTEHTLDLVETPESDDTNATQQTTVVSDANADQVTSRPIPESISSLSEKPSESNSLENGDENNPRERPSITTNLDPMLLELINTLGSDRPGVTIESSNSSNIAHSIELSADEIREQFETVRPSVQSHTGVTIQFGVNGSELVVDSSGETASCAIDFTTGQLTNGSLVECDEEFTRISERLRFILNVITNEPSSL